MFFSHTQPSCLSCDAGSRSITHNDTELSGVEPNNFSGDTRKKERCWVSSTDHDERIFFRDGDYCLMLLSFLFLFLLLSCCCFPASSSCSFFLLPCYSVRSDSPLLFLRFSLPPEGTWIHFLSQSERQTFLSSLYCCCCLSLMHLLLLLFLSIFTADGLHFALNVIYLFGFLAIKPDARVKERNFSLPFVSSNE